MVILAKKLIYTVDIWATQFQLTVKSMWTIERLSHLPVLTCKVLHEFDAFVERYYSGEIYLMNTKSYIALFDQTLWLLRNLSREVDSCQVPKFRSGKSLTFAWNRMFWLDSVFLWTNASHVMKQLLRLLISVHMMSINPRSDNHLWHWPRSLSFLLGW
jgi:hypothetical protein